MRTRERHCAATERRPLGNLLLEHQRQRSPPRRPSAAKPLHKKGGADIVGQVRDDMRAVAGNRAFVDRERVGLQDIQTAAELFLKLGESRDAAWVSLDRDDRRSGVEQRMGQPSRAWTDLVHPLSVERSRNCRNSGEQLPVENEVLTERLAGTEAVPRDDLA